MPSKTEHSPHSNPEEKSPKNILQTRMSRRRAVMYTARGAAGILFASGAGGFLYSSREIDGITQEAAALEIPNSPSVNKDILRSRYIANEMAEKNVHTKREISAAAVLGFITVFVSERIYSLDMNQQTASSSPSESQAPNQTS